MTNLLHILEDLHPDIDFVNCNTLVDDGILDSFDIVTIVSEIADCFGVIISANEIVPNNFNSATALYALIDTKLNQKDE